MRKAIPICSKPARPALAAALAGLAVLSFSPAGAQGWQTESRSAPANAAAAGAPNSATAGKPPAANTTVVPRAAGAQGAPASTAATGKVGLTAQISAEGQATIQQGLVWRIFQDTGEGEAKAKLVATHREAAPLVQLPAGSYYVNVAFGRANLTRKITVNAGSEPSQEQFILNAGGLKLAAVLNNDKPTPPKSVAYDILSEERDQFGNRTKVMTGARPGLIIRLNAGIYQIVSTYGDANATVRADVTVEAGKLTVATIKHTAATVTFKLVSRPGGEALAGTQWTLNTRQGTLVKESVGALPNHIIAPGNYTIIARNGTRVFKRDFAVQAGDIAQVEVVIQ